jgi:uncharacterized membrane protein YidH (DUF202 family)
MTALNAFLAKVADQIINPIITLLALAGFVLFVWGVVEFIQGAENEEKRTVGQQHMMWGVIGLAVIFGAKAIVTFAAGLFGLTVPSV